MNAINKIPVLFWRGRLFKYSSLGFEKWPLSLKITVILLMNSLFLVGVWFMLFKNEVGELKKLQAFEVFQKKHYAVNVSRTKQKKVLNRQLMALKNLYKHQVGRFCFSTNQSLKNYFFKQAGAAKIKISAVTLELMREQDKMFVQPVNVRFEGSVRTVDLFFQQLSRYKRIVDIGSLSLMKQGDRVLGRGNFIAVVNDNN